MTLHELFALAALHHGSVALGLTAPVATALALGRTHAPHAVPGKAVRYAYSAAVYLSTLPGVAAILLCLYTVAATHQNLLDVEAGVYFGPILAMIATLVIVGRQVEFSDLPGVDRIWGLLMMLGATMLLLFALSRTRFVVGFFGSLWSLLAIFVVLFLVIRLGAGMALGRSRREALDP